MFKLALPAILAPSLVHAEPVTAAIAAGTILGSSTLFSVAVSLAVSIVFTGISMLLMPSQRVSVQKREIAQPQSRPPYRFVYGRNRVYGTPLPLRTKGSVLYGCLLLNSRPSKGGNIQIAIDKREATIASGDIYDFSGNGASLTLEGFPDFANPINRPRVWIGLGDQTAPPQTFTNEAPEFFATSDAWRGRTVMWLRFEAGGSKAVQRRWPRVPPEVEVEMDWSLIWDMRDPTQDPDDPETWKWSNNQALVLLDAARTNPIRQYTLNMIHLPSFQEGADVADIDVDLFHEGGTEKKYAANGLLIFRTNEIVDQLTPIAMAGAGDLVRIGGKLGYAPGAWREPIVTVTDIVAEGGINLETLRPGSDFPRAVRASFIAPDRDWQEAEVPALPIVGGQGIGEDGVMNIDLPFVTSATQAMRIQQIKARKIAMQKTLSVMLWPEAFNVVAGSNIEIALPPAFKRINALWQIETANPGLWTSDEGEGIALRIPVTAHKTGPEVYEWVPATDEFEMITQDFNPLNPGFENDEITPPSNLNGTPGSPDSQLITVTVVEATDTFVDGVEVLFSSTNLFSTAQSLGEQFVGPGNTATFEHTGLGFNITYYYWARSVQLPNQTSTLIGPISVTSPGFTP